MGAPVLSATCGGSPRDARIGWMGEASLPFATEDPMKCTPLLIVDDVARSRAWYGDLLGLEGAHGGDEFEMLMSADGQLQLMLHHPATDEHAGIADPAEGKPGRGVLLYFSVVELAPVFERAREAGADVVDEPHPNPKAGSLEFTLRDPDGYVLTVSEWRGTAASPQDFAAGSRPGT